MTLLAHALMLWRQMDDAQREKAVAFMKAQGAALAE